MAYTDDDTDTNSTGASKKRNSASPSIATPPNFSDTQSGANATPNSAESVSGRPLGIGQMVGGVPTFSDGSIPGSSKTITDDQLQQLKSSTSQPSNPYFGPEGGITSGALAQMTGNAGATPTVDQGMSTLNRGIAQPPQGYDPTAAVRGYKTDVASIINKDPRSTLGTAAWNAYADSVWDKNTGGGRAGRQQAKMDYQNNIAALMGQAKGAFDAQNQAGIDEANNAARNSIASLESLTSRNNANLNYSSRLASAEARADALRYGADSRSDAMRDVATTNASRPRTNAAFEHGSAMAYSNAYTQAKQGGANDNDAIAAAQKSRAAFEQRNNELTTASAQPGAASSNAPATLTSQADFDKLPSGALYTNPSDGKTYRKK